jgi:hypothetical protein
VLLEVGSSAEPEFPCARTERTEKIVRTELFGSELFACHELNRSNARLLCYGFLVAERFG